MKFGKLLDEEKRLTTGQGFYRGNSAGCNKGIFVESGKEAFLRVLKCWWGGHAFNGWAFNHWKRKQWYLYIMWECRVQEKLRHYLAQCHRSPKARYWILGTDQILRGDFEQVQWVIDYHRYCMESCWRLYDPRNNNTNNLFEGGNFLLPLKWNFSLKCKNKTKKKKKLNKKFER